MSFKSMLFQIIVGMCVLSCSSGIEKRFIPTDGFSEDPLDYTDVSRTLLTEQNYFVAYSQGSGRLGIVDADSYKEIWGRYTDKDVPFVFNLPGHEGAGLVSPGKFSVVIKEGIREFSFPYSASASWSRAKSSIMLAAFDSVIRSVSIVKYRGDVTWETATFEPFPASNVPVDDSVVIAGSGGKSAILVEPLTGSYVAFNDVGGQFSKGPDCLSAETLVDGPIKSLAIDETSGHAYAAVGKKIFQFAMMASSACVVPTSWVEVFSGDTAVKRVGTLEGGKVFAILASGQVEVFAAASGVITKERSLIEHCIEPVSVNNFGPLHLALTCVVRFADGSDSIANAQLVVFDSGGEKIFTHSIYFEKKASVVFYPEKAQYFEVFDSAAGEIDVHTVPSSEMTQLRGLFIGGILNRL